MSGLASALDLVLSVNGAEHALTLDPRVTLLDALRDHLHLHGTKKGCDHGLCGACTVLVDGERRVSCLMLAATAEGRYDSLLYARRPHILHVDSDPEGSTYKRPFAQDLCPPASCFHTIDFSQRLGRRISLKL